MEVPKDRRAGRFARIAGPTLALFLATACAREAERAAIAPSDAPDVDWALHGLTPDEQRYSLLAQIDEDNVARLGLAWQYDLETTRGVEATPLVVDGVMVVTGPWSVVHALDARSGRALWQYDPSVPRQKALDACCDVVNRGVAAADGRIFVGTLDGRLVALDAATGRPIWETLTFDPEQPYTITGAPRVVHDLVVIGNGGAEYGVRGYVSAYHADSGALAWRTWTVPGDPNLPFESKALERAAATWSGEWWKMGGGGTVWDGMAFDPELDLLYVGTGNGGPYPIWERSPGRGGDNLYLSSILALRPRTGELVWHFQTTPGDSWDYTATQHILLADLVLDGRPRKVLMQAPKNGYFWVLDRETGEFLSAAPYTTVTWSKGVDAKGRPIVDPARDYRETPQLVHPGPAGGHNWHPMSFHPGTGLVYIPAFDIPMLFSTDDAFTYRPGRLNTGLDFTKYMDVDEDEKIEIDAFLLAWDPVAQREAWRVRHVTTYNGGVLSTAGNLVFQGTADGRFVAYRANDGAKLWEAPAGTGVMAAPITYRIDGVQYVSVAAGWGGSFALNGGPAAQLAGVWGGGRVLTYALDAKGDAPPIARPRPPTGHAPRRPSAPPDPALLDRGLTLYGEHCMGCHGPQAISGGAIVDLRDASQETLDRLEPIVLGGERLALGMPSFAERLGPDDLPALRAYLLSRNRRTDAAN
ncbi:MAG: PQQ-dependent dehydrogenase, methanol/ethanol family [Myxococcota bacterium]